jgi:hypothetical protein
MKTRIILCMALLLMVIPFGSVAADPALPPDVTYNGAGVWTVFPHNSSPEDPDRIQATVDLAKPGDTVQLAQGEFDFSEFEYVRIAKDLTLEGAWDKSRQTPLTLIKHGYNPVIIGRKTPVKKPLIETIDGQPVYHITTDLSEALYYPMGSLEPGEPYSIFDDWTPVTVNVRQIAFERPFGTAILSSAMKGGTIERIRVASAWPQSFDFNNMGTGASGVSWYNLAINYIIASWLGDFGNPEWYYTGTDLVSGNLVVQDSVFEGDWAWVSESQNDADGDPIMVLYEENTPPPNGAYEKYVLQDVVLEWDEYGAPLPGATKVYWVQKGYVATAWQGLHAERGIGNGIYSLYSESNLTIRRNVIKDCMNAEFFVLNGVKGAPFKATIENNQIITPLGAGWGPAFMSVGWDLYDPFTGETLVPDPGEEILFRNNSIQSSDLEGGYWAPIFGFQNYGKAKVVNNHFDMQSGVGIWLSWPAESVEVVSNTFTGSGDYALYANWGSNGHRWMANDLRGFTPTGYGYDDGDLTVPPGHVLLLSDGNLVVGGPGGAAETVWDLGNNNTVVGMNRMTLNGLRMTETQGKAFPQKDRVGVLHR